MKLFFTVKFLDQSRLFSKKMRRIDPDFLELREIWVNTTNILRNRRD